MTGKTLFVCIDSDEDTDFYIADTEAVDRYWEENPDADNFEVAQEVGRELTSEEYALLPFDIVGTLSY